jgi:hypothetical protein
MASPSGSGPAGVRATTLALLALLSPGVAAAGLPSQPTEQWRYHLPSVDPTHPVADTIPVVAQLTDDNGDGLVDATDSPDVAFLASETGGNGLDTGLVAVDGSVADGGGLADPDAWKAVRASRGQLAAWRGEEFGRSWGRKLAPRSEGLTGADAAEVAVVTDARAQAEATARRLGEEISDSAAQAAVDGAYNMAMTPVFGGSLDDAARGGVRFGQRGVSPTFRGGEFAGRTIEDVAAGLRSGAISPDQLPLQVITRDGVTYTLNNRSLMALRQAGMEPTVLTDVTGVTAHEATLTSRLAEMGGSAAPDFVPNVRPR